MDYYKEVLFSDFYDNRGHLIAIESGYDIPFDIKRVYYITDVKKGVSRGFHAHRDLQQIILCIKGNVKLKIITPVEEKIFLLNDKSKGLLLGPYTWREIYEFSEDAVLLVLASQHYSEDDYIRSLEEYREEVKYRC